MSSITFSILGPIDVRCGSDSITPVGQASRTLLAALLLKPNQTVSADELIEILWSEPPPSATNALQVYISRLRKHLARPESPGELVLTRRPGYMIRIEDGALDAERFRAWADEGHSAKESGAPAIAARRFSEALSLWRGPFLADLMFESFVASEAEIWEESRLTVLQARIDADLQLGRHAELVGEIRSLVSQHPFRETFRAQLMLALYRSGRQADALQAYHDARIALASELGLEPAPELASLHSLILSQDPSLEVVGDRERIAPAIGEAGSLPLIGRSRELAVLDDALRLSSRGRKVVVTVEGPPGHGKTRLLDDWLNGLDHSALDVRRASAFKRHGSLPGDVAARLHLKSAPLEEAERLSVVVLDDAQWADFVSLGQLADAVAGAPGLGVLIFLSHRPFSGLHKGSLDRVRDRVGPDERVHLSLRSLRAHDLAPLIDGDDPLAIAASFIEGSRGVPFMLQRLITECMRAGSASFANGRIRMQAGALKEFWDFRPSDALATLSSEERRLLEVLCLARVPLPAEITGEVAGLTPDVVGEVIRSGPLESFLSRDPDGLKPVHDLAADEVIDHMDDDSRRSLLRRLADRVPGTGFARDAISAAYLLDADADEEAIPLLARAALGLVEETSYLAAMPVLDSALAAIARSRSNLHLEARLRRARAMSFDFVGRFDFALEDFQVAEQIDDETSTEALTIKAYLAMDRTEVRASEVSFAFAAAHALSTGDETGWAGCLARHAAILSMLGFVDEAADMISKASRLAGQMDDLKRFDLGWWSAMPPLSETDARVGESLLRPITEKARAMGDEIFTDVGRWLARDLFFLGKLNEAVELSEKCLGAASRAESSLTMSVLSNWTWGLGHCGLYDRALSLADEELRLCIQLAPLYEFLPRLHRSVALLGLGRLDEARYELENADILAPPEGDGWYIRIRCRVTALRLIAAAGELWPREVARSLSDETKRTRRLVPLAETLTLRAAQEGAPELAEEAAHIGLDIAAPMVAARAIDASGLWGTPLGESVARRMREMLPHVPQDMFEEWTAQPEVSSALRGHPAVSGL